MLTEKLDHRFVITAGAAAAILPALLAYNVSPSPTYLNQALAFLLWAGFVAVSAPARPGRGPWAVWAVLAVLAGAALWSWGPGSLPSSLAMSALATLFAAAVVLAGGAGARARPEGVALFTAFAWAWVAAGVFNIAIALVQVFAPGVPDGEWLAASGIPGRAVGNLRQPNHLSSLLLWHCIAVVALFELGRLRRVWAGVLLALGVFAVVLTASRTGLVSVLLLACWGLLDRRLSRTARVLLLAAPLVYALSWLGMAQWAALTQHTFGGAQRLAEADVGGSRVAIWRDTLTMIAQQPWAGVGFGEFNLAWTLTPLPQRPLAFFDHTHNLPLQLAVELGLPLAVLVTGLLLWALWAAGRAAWRASGDAGTAQRAAVLMVVMIGLHSLLEYPLWYSYFLLPAAWAWGYALQPAAKPVSASLSGPASAAAVVAQRLAPPSRALAAAAALVAAGAVFSVVDYLRVAAIFSASAGSKPLAVRVAEGQQSVFFAHHADYAAVTAGLPVPDPERAFARAVHFLLDARLMMAWADSLAKRGKLDEASHIAERLREFRRTDAEEFFAVCETAASAPAAPMPAASTFACRPPTRALGWRAFTAAD
ncbi:PglL family O-oligosaccharyltransferase [Rubrivivax rivuli]|uniref:Polymerase n=1 Tax=Rubrivivax rivuli TaxID=1862385 RepID=A0A437RQS9_9BURK|nr:O-antigen ligase family protein [Rubrivivax rivuli]RVU49128.1 polymerase [Rubrivivax rivuli]